VDCAGRSGQTERIKTHGIMLPVTPKAACGRLLVVMLASAIALVLVFLLGLLLDRLDAASGQGQKAFARLSLAQRKAKPRARHRPDLQHIAQVWKR